MAFEDEWADIKAEAAKQQESHVRLNQLDDGNGGRGIPQKKLKVTASVLRNKAGKVDHVSTGFAKADNETMTETGQVKASLKGFDCAAAFATFQERWGAQMRYAQGLLSQGLAGPLRDAATHFEVTDKGVGDGLDRGKKQGGGQDKVAR
ncbi:type VII secretion target [Streptomyces sp. NPDC127074]|uniref:type VII secretion target n=1 Tax=Streptomyces sp. NPDC127074 TaxID=3347130 RepID=UPI003660B2DA